MIFSLYFSAPMRDVDWSNLSVSQVKCVMLPFNEAFSTDDTLIRLKSMGVSVVLRLFPEDMDKHAGELQGRMFHVMSLCNLIAIQVDNEPERNFGFTWGPDWGIDFAYQSHLPKIDGIRRALQGHGVKIITPGWKQRDMNEGGYPYPGQVAWSRACQPTYGEFDGNGVHIYEMGWFGLPPSDPNRPDQWGSYVDVIRFLFKVGYWQSTWHKNIWITEFNIDKGPNVVIPQTIRMAACLSAARTIRGNDILRPRVDFFCPFVSNGFRNNTYPTGMIMDDPACYTMVRDYMAGH